MITNPLLEEIWATKARLDAESGGDIHVFCQQLREWSAKNLPERMVICDPAEVRGLVGKKEAAASLVLREEPPEGGEKQG